jgi:hypothetical protein
MYSTSQELVSVESNEKLIPDFKQSSAWIWTKVVKPGFEQKLLNLD